MGEHWNVHTREYLYGQKSLHVCDRQASSLDWKNTRRTTIPGPPFVRLPQELKIEIPLYCYHIISSAKVLNFISCVSSPPLRVRSAFHFRCSSQVYLWIFCDEAAVWPLRFVYLLQQPPSRESSRGSHFFSFRSPNTLRLAIPMSCFERVLGKNLNSSSLPRHHSQVSMEMGRTAYR